MSAPPHFLIEIILYSSKTPIYYQSIINHKIIQVRTKKDPMIIFRIDRN